MKAKPDIKIRLVKKTDSNDWLAMRRALWPDCPPKKHREEMAEILADKKDQPAWVAESLSGEPAGFLEAAVRNYADGAGRQDVGYLEGWYVKPKFRKMGVGRALVKAAEEWAVGRGFSHMGSDTWVGNMGSYKAHQAMGYKDVGRDIHFVKKLKTKS
ncbi:MAG: GNAT family N-acetyltransferase [Candidatus Edwardsbacteria bacterium]|nr:GNAT family N-acetyltransferase [Candidatus Edwardsbacteria bacterium]MBU1576171.1 GNAT family N-acetyltransferase [Candidatus Edwardsbacteria bacterium]MBU2593211.1 GNAT family N-acetyltransferase [Candidatus Edwardsbacteria bacterium]